MAINFPDSPTNGQVATVGGKNYTYNSTKNTWTPTQVTEADLSTVGSTTVVATHDLLPASPSAGDMALVSSVNKMYVYFLSGWWLMSSLQNASPSGITGNAAIYDLAADGTPTTVTLSSSDPEGFPIVWSHSVISGSLGGTTVTNVNNVFTITPSTDAADAGTFTLRFAASDGQGGESGSQSQFTLDFAFIVTNSRYTTLLATADGTSDNNNITDASTNNHSITVNGDAHAGTFSPYRHSGYSTYFPDTDGNAYVSANSSDYALGSGALTVSAWIYIDNNTQQQTIIDNQTGSGAGWYLKIWPGQLIRVHNQSSYIFDISNSDAPTAVNEWIHLCWTRDGSGNNKLFLNGTQVGTTVTDTTNFTAQGCKLGETYQGVNDLKGYIKDVHIVAGYANEPTTSSIATAVTSSTGTVFLGCSGPDFLERSSSPKTITINDNNIFIRPFSPYDNLEYSVTDHGGSVYFDGTGDALRIADNSNIQLGTSSFTIEGWFYCNDTTPTQGILAKRDGSSEYWRWIIAGGNLNFRFQSAGGGSFTCNTVSVPTKTWCHFAVTRDSNNDVRQFVNGISTQNAINSTGNFDISGSSLRVGEYELNTGHFSGFVSDIKIIKNSALYTTDFTPPNAPLSSSGAELHIKGTDASIIDKSQGANIKLVGNTTGSTTQVKFADTKSIYFDGTGDEIQTPTSELFRYGTGDFTWEFWTNPSSQGTYDYIITQGSSPAGTSGLGLYLQGGVFKVYHSGAAIIIGTTSISNNTWYHVALAREGTTMRLFLDGTLEGSATNSADIQPGTSYGVVIGRWTEIGDSQYYDGYLQDLRVTKGLARYTANFTPPTASLEG
jgi:hypothetical protein